MKFNFPANAVTDQPIGAMSAGRKSQLQIRVSGIVGASTLKVQGRPIGSGGAYTDLAYTNETSGAVVAGGTPMSVNGLYEVDVSGQEVNLQANVAAAGALVADAYPVSE